MGIHQRSVGSMIFLLSMSPHRDRAVQILLRFDPALALVLVDSREKYDQVVDDIRGDALLLSYDSGILIPALVLNRLTRPAYNFHPAPPDYPGRDPNHFAIYDRVTRYGATVHEMVASIDAGPIVAVDYFDVDPIDGPEEIKERSRQALEAMFETLAPAFVSGRPIPRLDIAWGLRKTTRAMFRQMCELSADIDAEEFDRRFKAFDGREWNNLTVTIHGRRFRIEK